MNTEYHTWVSTALQVERYKRKRFCLEVGVKNHCSHLGTVGCSLHFPRRHPLEHRLTYPRYQASAVWKYMNKNNNNAPDGGLFY
jgi:hypothetical protein